MKSDEKALCEMKSDEKALFEMKNDEKILSDGGGLDCSRQRSGKKTRQHVGWIKCPLGLAVKSVRGKSECRKNRKPILQVTVLPPQYSI